jgi:hypothetical protein
MTDDTSINKTKADVENWRRGYEAALAGKTFLLADGERTSAWRLGYRDGRALRLKLRMASARSTIAADWLAAGRRERSICIVTLKSPTKGGAAGVCSPQRSHHCAQPVRCSTGDRRQ